ncbi:hypothetical protein [Hyphomicrobium sp. CS1GBMeth3]|uniref:hypothetical protein n=1 Tax=Hyphomicrobium sp. CS1GBMeth3 TaxID=1892845 RepID=UPI000932046F|nr:hypothetical protein [Hyphomicrobium sp. CS1GBMeth3]
MPFYTNDEIREIKRAFDLACADLGLRPNSRSRPLREELGSLMFDIAATGVDDCTSLRRQSVRQFQRAVGAGVLPDVARSTASSKRTPSDRSGH